MADPGGRRVATVSSPPTEHLSRVAVRGAGSTMLAQLARLPVQLLTVAILARLLAPEDFGVVALALVVTGAAELVRDLGLSSATVQRKDLRQDQASALFWLQLLLGLTLVVLVVVCAGWIAGILRAPEVATVLPVAAVTFLLNGATAQHQAMLQRDLQFAFLARVDLITFCLASVAAVLGALAGMGFWALVLQPVTMSFSRLLLIVLHSSWRPSRPARAAGVGELLGFGANLTLFQILNYVARTADNVVVGRLFGTAALGVYTRAYALLLLPLRQVNAPLSRVAVPILSRLQDQPERFRTSYCRMMTGLSWTVLPALCAAAGLAQPLVQVLLGDQWAASAPLFQVFAISGVFTVIAYANGWLYVSTGRTGRQAVWGLASRPLLVVGFIVGANWGVMGVAVAYTVVTVLLTPPSFVVACWGSPVRVCDIAASCWRGFVAAVATAAATWLTALHMTDEPAAVTLTVGAVVAVSTVAAAAAVLPGAQREIAQLRRLVALARSVA